MSPVFLSLEHPWLLAPGWGGPRVRSRGLQGGVCFEIHQESLLLVGRQLKEVSLSTSSRALWERMYVKISPFS